MPTKNIVKQYGEEQFYHVYNRGVAKADIFREESDYTYFLYLLKRALVSEQMEDKLGRPYANYHDQVELVAYCLMPNHYHMLLYLKEKQGIELLMRSVMTAYSMYFNKKYHRVGSLFQNHFLASRIDSDEYLWHVSRYIHLNPLDIGKDYDDYRFSSLKHYLGEMEEEWVHVEYLVDSPAEYRKYARFVADDEAMHRERSLLKTQLAHE